MHSSKLLKILKNLTEEEIRRFHKFIRSPYYSYKKHCLLFFEYIRRYYPDFTSSKLSKENAFHHLFPNKAFQSQKMRHVMTDLVNLLEDFLVAEQIKQDDFQRKKLLRDAYGDRDLYEYFEKSTEAITNTLEALPYRNSFYQHESMKNQEVYFFHPSTKKHLVKENYLESINEHLDQYFTLSKLQLATEMKARASILSKTYEISYLVEILKKADSSDPIPIEASLYKSALQLYEKDTLEQFVKLKEHFLENIQKLSATDRTFLFYHLLNFTIRKGNAGQQVFLKESFALYQVGLEMKILINKGRFADSTYTNICAAGIKVEEYRWVHSFIEGYTHCLDTEIRSSAKTLCMAFLFYAQGNYKKTESLINSFQFSNAFYQSRGKLLFLRALFELFLKDGTYYEVLQSSALAFEKFLRRNPILSKSQKDVYLGFIQYIRLAGKLFANYKLDSVSAERLKKRILQEKAVANREWLIQKLDKIKDITFKP